MYTLGINAAFHDPGQQLIDRAPYDIAWDFCE
jgi:hypothetical protein